MATYHTFRLWGHKQFGLFQTGQILDSERISAALDDICKEINAKGCRIVSTVPLLSTDHHGQAGITATVGVIAFLEDDKPPVSS